MTALAREMNKALNTRQLPVSTAISCTGAQRAIKLQFPFVYDSIIL